ncbi:MAG: OmpA family protein [Bacteroidia bacterium]|nr:OmpA family protein [Bacteroidia bacterium]MCO5253538.1 OmpA family protein [Bacteroidota bacterium]
MKKMNYPAIFRMLALFFLSCIMQQTFAQNEVSIYSEINYGEEITDLSNPYFCRNVVDDKYVQISTGTSWSLDYKHIWVKNRAILGVRDSLSSVDAWHYAFDLEVVGFDTDDDSTINYVTLDISYDPASTHAYKDKHMFEIEGYHKFGVRIIAIRDSLDNGDPVTLIDLKRNFFIESEIETYRYFKADYSTPVTSLTHGIVNNVITISWTLTGESNPNQYELEWTFVDTCGREESEIEYDFKYNSSRVLLSEKNYSFSMVYDGGVLLYRVRRVRPDSVEFKHYKYSQWYPNKPDHGILTDWGGSNKVYMDIHTNGSKNWQFSMSFAEEGLQKEVVNYFDGSLKRRQGATYLNSENLVLIDESIYDYHGREAITVLPAPGDSSYLSFHPRFNVNETGNPYGSSDFDSIITTGGICERIAPPMGTQSGASRYYSPDNEDTTGKNRFIPNAFGYPFAHTEYMQDGTGRIRRQGGVGISHQLGSNHETRYYYGKPDQELLDRLFGSEAGYNKHYKRNVVQDPNGQMSISLIDQHGRVIATSLAGGVPGLVDTVGSFENVREKVIHLTGDNKILDNKSIVLSYPFTVVSEGIHKFLYNVETPGFVFGCLGLDTCFGCVYDLSFTITDECNTPVVSFTKKIGTLDELCNFEFDLSLQDLIVAEAYDELYDEEFELINGDSIQFYLNIGSYKLQKTLTVNTDSVQYMFEEWMSRDTCVKTREDFYTQYYNEIDFSGCCDTCEQEMDFCESFRMGMEQDLMPGGQYFTYSETEDGVLSLPDSTSILYLNLDRAVRYYALLPTGSFKNANGVADTVDINGNRYLPQQIDFDDFIKHWKPSWTDALIELHPEYCNYKFCVDSLSAVNAYEELMYKTNSYDSAVARGLLNPLDNRANYGYANLDPLYFNGSSINARGTAMRDSMWEFPVDGAVFPIVGVQGDDYSIDIWTLSASLAYCSPFEDDPYQMGACMLAWRDTTVKNDLFNNREFRDLYWQKFRGLYLSKRRIDLENKMLNDKGEYYNETYKNCITGVGLYGDYVNKVPRFPMNSYVNKMKPVAATETGMNNLRTEILDSMKKHQGCEGYLPMWEEQLSNCPGISPLIMDTLLGDLLRICKGASIGDPDRPQFLGGKKSQGIYFEVGGPNTFEEVMIEHLGSEYKSAYCNLDLLGLPMDSGHNYLEDKSFGKISDCQCRQLEEEKDSFFTCESEYIWDEQLANTLLSFFQDLAYDSLLRTNAASHSSPITLNTSLTTQTSFTDLFGTTMGFVLNDVKYSTSGSPLPSNELALHIPEVPKNTENNNGFKCNFRLFLKGGAVFGTNPISQIDSIRPSLDGHDFDLYVQFMGVSRRVGVNSTCFKPSVLCNKNSDLIKAAFLRYFNRKYNSNLNIEDYEYYNSVCSGPGPDSDCSPGPTLKDLEMIAMLNEKIPSLGLTSGSADYKCSTNETDYLVSLSSYRASFFDEYHKYHNFWWESPILDIDDAPINNTYDDPWFAGKGYIGAICYPEFDTIIHCEITFGDPFGELASVGGFTGITSFTGIEYDYKLGQYLVTATNGGSSARLTYNSCYSGCKTPPLSTLHPIEGLGETTASYSYKEQQLYALYSFLNKMAENDSLAKPQIYEIPPITIKTKRPFNPLRIPGIYNDEPPHDEVEDGWFIEQPLYAPIIVASGGSEYRAEAGHGTGFVDSMLIAYIGEDLNDDTKPRCQWNLRKTGNGNNYMYFSEIEFFYDLKPDNEMMKKLIMAGNVKEAGYHFIIKAGKEVGVGDTTWIELRGWNTCMPLFDLEARDFVGMMVQALPSGFGNGCECLTCPQVQEHVDSLFKEYPDLQYNHPNYASVLTTFLNKHLNTNLSFAEYQTFMEGCGMFSRIDLRSSTCDYRISVASGSDCVAHLDTQLRHLYVQTSEALMYSKTKVSADSIVYCIDLSMFDATGRLWAADTLEMILAETGNCSGANNQEDFVGTFSRLLILTQTEPACDGRTLSEVVTNQSYSDSISITSYYSLEWLNYLNDKDTGYYYQWNHAELSFAKRADFADTLQVWALACDDVQELVFPFHKSGYAEGFAEYGICRIVEEDTFCNDCEEIRHELIKYQYALGTPSNESPLRYWTSKDIRKVLKDSLNADYRVVFENDGCQNCPDKKLFVCEQLSEGGNAFATLLNNLLADGNLFENHDLTSDTALLRKMNFTGAFNSPQLLFSSNMSIDTIGESPGWVFDTLASLWNLQIKFNQKTTLKFSIVLEGDGTSFSDIKRILSLKPKANNGEVYSFELVLLTENDVLNAIGESNGLVMSNCCEYRELLLCPKTMSREGLYPVAKPCKADEIANAWEQSGIMYLQYKDSLRRDFKNKYVEHCLNNASENALMKYREQQYHYTLYHYDLAGNLIKTVPPGGVEYLDMNALRTDSIADARDDYDKDLHVFTKHGLASLYEYNSLNQPVWQATPDGGVSKFWYDRLGRLVVSQNAKQKLLGDVYSYTVYDSLGRIREVGEITGDAINEVSLRAEDGYEEYYMGWVDAGLKTQITRTWYDAPMSEDIDDAFGVAGQQYLRNRVSSTAYFEYAPTGEWETEFTRATHYSYDIHGNVHTLIQDLPELASVGHRFKYVRYDYDLVSGNVKRVRYQENAGDAFYHRYEYDADNRLVLTETSLDERIWDRDAEYEYYLHGPLARVLIGEKMVQGVDYAYSLHGWLKGVNSVSLNANRDMGRDGVSGGRRYVARDAFGFALNYYYDANSEADYEAIAPGANWNGGRLETQLTSGANQLFNGNINSMVTSVTPFMEGGPMATVYRYDQLNRIKGMKTYRNFNQSTNVWNSGGTSNFFATNYSYDANGNILSLNRNSGDGSKLGMDALTYHYKAGTNQLEYVDDAVTAGEHENDVDDQEEDNYVYDAIGNLVQDVAEGIEAIEWNVYGKVRRIVRSSSAVDKPDLEFRYDAGGQRVVKIVKDGANEIDWKYQYYVRDAQGNVMATYDKKSVVSGDTSVYRKINEWLITNEGGTAFGEFVDGELKGGQFDGALIEAIVEWSETENVLSGYDASDFWGWDANMASLIMQQIVSYASPPTEYEEVFDLVWNGGLFLSVNAAIVNSCGVSTQNMLQNLLMSDMLNNHLLMGLYTQSAGTFIAMYSSMGGLPPYNAPGMINWMWMNSTNIGIATEILNFYSPTQIQTALDGMPYVVMKDFAINNFSDFVNTINLCMIALPGNFWSGFSNQGMLRDIIMNHSAAEYLLALAMSNDPDFVKNVAENYSYLVAEAVRKLDGMSVDAYLALVRNHYGDGVLADLLAALSEDLIFTQKFVLDEHHLYGSSRLGVKTHRRVLLRKEFSISGFEEDGTYITDEVTDSLVYVASSEYFCRVLAQKQYELSNHLGNVLATVLDRRTGVFDEGADTLMYYVADVVSATLYYPFGQAMLSYSNIEFAFTYGFNGKEKDEEGMGGGGATYDYGFRIYNPQIARFLSVDPLSSSFPWYTPYQFAGNMPIIAIDLDGLEEFVIIRWWENGKYKGTTVTYLPNKGSVRFYRNNPQYVNHTMYLDMEYSERQYNLMHGGKIFKTMKVGDKILISALSDEARSIIYNTDNNQTKPKEGSILTPTPVNEKERIKANQQKAAFSPENNRWGGSEITPKVTNLHYNTDNSDPLVLSQSVIDGFAAALLINPDYVIRITGHTDNVGTDQYNRDLGLRRAEETRDYLISKGISPDRIVVETQGESNPISSNETSEGRAQNRRVEISIEPQRLN